MPLEQDSKGRSVVPLFINGQALPIDESRVQPVKSSVTDETVHYYASADLETCEQACETAWTAFAGTTLDTACPTIARRHSRAVSSEVSCGSLPIAVG